jgi:hypothetical protein
MKFATREAPLPPANYVATFEGTEEMPPHPDYGESCKLVFRVKGGPHDGKRTSVIVSTGEDKPATPANKLGRMLSGLTGKPIECGVEIDVEEYVGQTYFIKVEDTPNGKSTAVSGIMKPPVQKKDNGDDIPF